MAHISLFHYYRLFQKATGLPVMQYILRRRLLHGIYTISRGSGKTDAALRFGFDTYAGFYKAFCREFGSTPSEFLKNCRDILRGYDSVAKLTQEELQAIPYVILANQFACVAWFAGQEKYAELFEVNRQMTLWLIKKWEELKNI